MEIKPDIFQGITEATKAAALASKNAAEAALAAAAAATSTAVISNDITWMKSSLIRLEQSVSDMVNSFVTTAQHSDVLKQLEEHDKRLQQLETERTRTTLLLATVTGIGGLLVSLIVYHIMGH